MTVLFRKLMNLRCASLLKRYMQSTCVRNSYEGEGKTTVTLLNNNYDYGLMVDNVTSYGFVLNNGIKILGPMVIFPKTTLSWNIAESPDMNEASFSLLLNLDPKLDIVVIGLDDSYPYNAPFLLNIKDLFKKHKISTEILPIYKACSTFNFLNAEHRYAAAALIPPKPAYVEELYKLESKQDHKPFKNIEELKKHRETEKFLHAKSPWKQGYKPAHKNEKNK